MNSILSMCVLILTIHFATPGKIDARDFFYYETNTKIYERLVLIKVNEGYR